MIFFHSNNNNNFLMQTIFFIIRNFFLSHIYLNKNTVYRKKFEWSDKQMKNMSVCIKSRRYYYVLKALLMWCNVSFFLCYSLTTHLSVANIRLFIYVTKECFCVKERKGRKAIIN